MLTTDGTNACNDPSSHLPTPDNNGQGLFCAYADNTLRAIYNWDNSAKKYDLKWLKSVTQIGSRSGGDCGVAGATKSDRCANQLASGAFAFKRMSGQGGLGLPELDTSNLTTMNGMFADSAFNEAVGGWDTSKVTSMALTFKGASAFNQNIGEWDTSGVFDMFQMFTNASAFNGAIGAWDTSAVKQMVQMFFGASKFNQYIGDWNTSAVLSMSDMFSYARLFNQDISTKSVTRDGVTYTAWDIECHGDVVHVLDASTLDADISGWDTSGVTTMRHMFNGASNFDRDLQMDYI